MGVTEDAERTVGLGVCLDELICANQVIYKHAYQTDGNVCLGFQALCEDNDRDLGIIRGNN